MMKIFATLKMFGRVLKASLRIFNSLSPNPTKWSNTLGLALKGLTKPFRELTILNSKTHPFKGGEMETKNG